MHFFFAYYPYICITLLLAGLAFRYVTDPGDWNARSPGSFLKTRFGRGSNKLNKELKI
ncbi:respiratory nitrate reductase subunit gamma, partial [Bilophila wadsworthia]|uniref:respiratory nitrate reductase subunit gamma n=1 Tax=Bilophila wadsworthia TaxID=35833 RepID=UPI00243010FC